MSYMEWQSLCTKIQYLIAIKVSAWTSSFFTIQISIQLRSFQFKTQLITDYLRKKAFFSDKQKVNEMFGFGRQRL